MWRPQAPHLAGFANGIYLFGFPAAQMVQARWPGLPFAASLLLTLALACAAGYASWHAVESRALRLKRWRPAYRPAVRR